jgi:hypothetical protein
MDYLLYSPTRRVTTFGDCGLLNVDNYYNNEIIYYIQA